MVKVDTTDALDDPTTTPRLKYGMGQHNRACMAFLFIPSFLLQDHVKIAR
jgi:hypothetical protein